MRAVGQIAAQICFLLVLCGADPAVIGHNHYQQAKAILQQGGNRNTAIPILREALRHDPKHRSSTVTAVNCCCC